MCARIYLVLLWASDARGYLSFEAILSLQKPSAYTCIHSMWEALLGSREGDKQRANEIQVIPSEQKCKVEGGTSDGVIMRRDMRNCHMKIAPENFGLIAENDLDIGRGCCGLSWVGVRKWVTWSFLRC